MGFREAGSAGAAPAWPPGCEARRSLRPLASHLGSGIVSALIRRVEPSYDVSDKKILYIFPGQGSQYRGMGSDLVEQFPVARDLYARASAVVGYDMTELSFRDPREELGLTRFTQPALLTHELACLEAFREPRRRARFAPHSRPATASASIRRSCSPAH